MSCLSDASIELIEIPDSNLQSEEVARVINALIDSHRIRDILMKPVTRGPTKH